MIQITDLPIELFIDHLLPCVPLQDLLSLSCTCKYFALVCGDDTFWKRKTGEEYNFEGTGSARTSGFKHLYRGLRHPRVFVWGDGGNSRLALDKRKHEPHSRSYGPNVDYPIELDMQHRVVHLAAGGWSFHALTDEGKVLVWGTLNSTSFGTINDLGESGTEVPEPLALILPQRIRSLSVGRRHAVLFDGTRNIYILLQWGRPIKLNTPALDGMWPESMVVQVEAGWDVCTFLTQTGSVYAAFPFHGSLSNQLEERRTQGGTPSEVTRQGDEVPCVCTDIDHHPTRLPPIPDDLPILHPNALNPDSPPKLIQIAAGDKFVVGLTDGGHVLKLDFPTYDESELGRIMTRGDLCWNYLPKFCDVAHVRNEPGFRPQGQEQAPALEDLKVTHISAQFRTFVVYSTVGSSVVLLGDVHNNSKSPNIIPELQNRGVISVVLGDYHYCALTSNGELFSWGKYSNGALGLGSSSSPHDRISNVMAPPLMPHIFPRPPPQDAEVPTQVHFHHEDNVRDRYVFAVAASGWHCGALVIDLHSTSTSTEGKSNPTQEGEVLVKQDPNNPSHASMEYGARNNEASRQSPIASFPTRAEAERAAGTQVPQITMPIVRGRGAPFRIGYAARGAYAGRGAGSAFSGGSHSGSGAHPDRAER
ncbi:regulator of chromosome condensation 1/beta-lactamase-inhibitor protein II [Rhizoctonia solani]|nr:regulator of chromosome condensation 1/beta-lactamase-inhibitor protein II [Rhizoctonia solani]